MMNTDALLNLHCDEFIKSDGEKCDCLVTVVQAFVSVDHVER